MGRGRSALSKGGGGSSGGKQAPSAPANKTWSDIGKLPQNQRYSAFMALTDTEKYDAVDDIINDRNIVVPNYLDDSQTSKVMYALGMNNKPTIVDDSVLDNMQGTEIYRTVYELGFMPPPKSSDIVDQIRTGDYTQMSGRGGSVHGRALYFATRFNASASYGVNRQNAIVMRAKINKNAKIINETKLYTQINNDSNWINSRLANQITNSEDRISLYALAHGIDGWYDGSYTMMVNRGALTASKQNKQIIKKTSRLSSSTASWRSVADSWHGAKNV